MLTKHKINKIFVGVKVCTTRNYVL